MTTLTVPQIFILGLGSSLLAVACSSEGLFLDEPEKQKGSTSGESEPEKKGAGGEMPNEDKEDALDLGERCDEAEECGSGFCSDGVCCEEACDDACISCGNDGLCDVVPLDDDACGDIECPEDTSCRDYGDSLTEARCLGARECKGADHCEFRDAPARTTCGGEDSGFCDGEGMCERTTVPCGDELCEVGPGACCVAPTGGALCLTEQQSCSIGSAQERANSFRCHDEADCAPGSVCCLVSAPVAGVTVNSAQCYADACGQNSVQLCAVDDECDLDQTCEQRSNLPDNYGQCVAK